jgi:hypothetical protein
MLHMKIVSKYNANHRDGHLWLFYDYGGLMIPAINLEMKKSDISNFKEYCELRKFYNDLLYSDKESSAIYKATRRYGVGNTGTCPLCVVARKAVDPFEDEDKCDYCMWNLADSMISRPCLSIFDGYIFDRDLDMKAQLKERIEAMDYLIAEYENMEDL